MYDQILDHTEQNQKIFLQDYKYHNFLQLHFHHPNYFSRIFYIDKSCNLRLIKKKLQERNLLGLFDNFCYEFNKNIINMSLPATDIFPYQPNMPGNSFFIEIKITSYTQHSINFHFEEFRKILENPIRYKFLQIFSFEKNKKQLEVLQYTVNKKKMTQFHPTIQTIKSQYLNPKKHIRDVLNYDLTNNLRKNTYKGIRQPKLVKFFDVLKDKKISHNNSLKGHLMYFKLITLENKQFLIAGTEDGFICIEDDQKNLLGDAKTQLTGQYFISLLELFKSVSKKFESQFDYYLKHFKLDMIAYEQSRMQKQQLYWLTKPKQYFQESNLLQREKHFEYKNWSLMYYKDVIELIEITEKAYNQNADKNQVYYFELNYYLNSKNFFNALEKAMIFIATPLILNNMQSTDKNFNSQARLKGTIIEQDIKFKGLKPLDESYFYQFCDEFSTLQLNYVKNLSVIHKILKVQNIRPFFAGIVDSRGKKILVRQKIPSQYVNQSVTFRLKQPSEELGEFRSDPAFEAAFEVCLKKIAQQLNLQEEVICYTMSKDLNKVSKTFIISPFLTGFTYTGENYISQIGRLSVRDLNYLGTQNQRCFLRFQLLKKFRAYKDKKKEKYQKFNVNIEVDVVQLAQNQKLNDQIALLFEVANHIRVQAIPELIQSLRRQGQKALLNSKTISYVFHKCGINMRYLGQVAEHESIKNDPQIKLFLKRMILVRTLKQYFRLVMRQSKVSLLRQTVAHILNCVFGKIKILKQLQQKCFKLELEERQRKKRKLFSTNKLQNQNTKVMHLKSYTNYLHVGPKQVWKSILEVCKAKFNFDLCPSIYKQNQQGIFSYPYTKLATLQDLCQCIGICINQKNYDIIEISQQKLLKQQYQRQKQAQRQRQQQQKEKLKQKQKTKSKKSKKKKKGKQKQVGVQVQEEVQKVQKEPSNQMQKQMISQRQKINQNQEQKGQNDGLPFQAKDILQFTSRIQFIKEEFPDYGMFSLQSLQQSQSVAIFQMEDIKSFIQLRQKMQPIQDQKQVVQHMEEYQLIFLRLFEAQCIPFNFTVSQALTRLSKKIHAQQNTQVALYFALKNLYMMLITYGETYPFIFKMIMAIQKLYAKLNLPKFAIKFLLRMLDILQPVYGDCQMSMSYLHSCLASLFNRQKKFQECIQHHTKVIEILKKVNKPGDTTILDAQKLLKIYEKQIKEAKKNN